MMSVSLESDELSHFVKSLLDCFFLFFLFFFFKQKTAYEITV